MPLKVQKQEEPERRSFIEHDRHLAIVRSDGPWSPPLKAERHVHFDRQRGIVWRD